MAGRGAEALIFDASWSFSQGNVRGIGFEEAFQGLRTRTPRTKEVGDLCIQCGVDDRQSYLIMLDNLGVWTMRVANKIREPVKGAVMEESTISETLVPLFKLNRLLNQGTLDYPLLSGPKRC